MKAPKVNNFAALIGINWADKKHDMCEHVVGSESYQYLVIFNQPESLHQWAMTFKLVRLMMKKSILTY